MRIESWDPQHFYIYEGFGLAIQVIWQLHITCMFVFSTIGQAELVT